MNALCMIPEEEFCLALGEVMRAGAGLVALLILHWVTSILMIRSHI